MTIIAILQNHSPITRKASSFINPSFLNERSMKDEAFLLIQKIVIQYITHTTLRSISIPDQ